MFFNTLIGLLVSLRRIVTPSNTGCSAMLTVLYVVAFINILRSNSDDALLSRFSTSQQGACQASWSLVARRYGEPVTKGHGITEQTYPREPCTYMPGTHVGTQNHYS